MKLVLSDSYEITTKYFFVEVKNDPPIFDAYLPSDELKVKLNSVLIVDPMPITHDPEGMAYSKLIYYWTPNHDWALAPLHFDYDPILNKLTVKPKEFNQVDYWELKMVIDDYNLSA